MHFYLPTDQQQKVSMLNKATLVFLLMAMVVVLVNADEEADKKAAHKEKMKKMREKMCSLTPKQEKDLANCQTPDVSSLKSKS